MAGEKNSKYKPEYDEQAYKLCLLGMTDESIAFFFDVSIIDIAKWAYQNESFFNAITPSMDVVESIREKDYAKKERRRSYKKLMLEKSSSLRIENSTRARLYAATKGLTAGISGLDFTIIELKNHLEKLFSDGMSWDNYGDWHIDHKKPCALFNQEDPLQFSECWSLDNLQPLWAHDNLKKGKKYGSS